MVARLQDEPYEVLCPKHRSEVGRWATAAPVDASPRWSAPPAAQHGAASYKEDPYFSDPDEILADADDESYEEKACEFPFKYLLSRYRIIASQMTRVDVGQNEVVWCSITHGLMKYRLLCTIVCTRLRPVQCGPWAAAMSRVCLG